MKATLGNFSEILELLVNSEEYVVERTCCYYMWSTGRMDEGLHIYIISMDQKVQVLLTIKELSSC